MAKRLIKKGVKLTGLVIYCPKLEKDVKIPIERFYLNGWEQTDEGNMHSESGVNIDIACKCGNRHEIKI